MTRRNATTSACTNGDVLAYDAENRLTSITVGANTTTYVYDGDGNRVKKTVNGVSTYYVGNHYEVTNGVALKYYYFGKQRVAMRVGTNTTIYLHSDHLGSTSATSGASVSAQTYYAYGNIRSTTGTVPTDFGFTGQKRDASANLMFYNARYYDTVLGRFVSADTMVPQAGNPQSLNRYAYTLNNPVRFVDPTGHTVDDYYVFVQGCINYGQTPPPCGGDINQAARNDWHSYLDLLRKQVGLEQDEFESWMQEHVRFVRATNADSSELAQTVESINPGQGQIYLLGHSAGGAAIINYLKSLRAKSPDSIPHIGGAVSLDAPIGDGGDLVSNVFGQYIGFQRDRAIVAGRSGMAVDTLKGLGAWSQRNGIAVLTVSYADDPVAPGHAAQDIPFKLLPSDPGANQDFQWSPGGISQRHGYLFNNPLAINTLWSYLIEAQYLR